MGLSLSTEPQAQSVVMVLGEKYEVGRVIGKGRFGKVYSVRRVHDGQWFALKVIDKHIFVDSTEPAATIVRIDTPNHGGAGASTNATSQGKIALPSAAGAQAAQPDKPAPSADDTLEMVPLTPRADAKPEASDVATGSAPPSATSVEGQASSLAPAPVTVAGSSASVAGAASQQALVQHAEHQRRARRKGQALLAAVRHEREVAAQLAFRAPYVLNCLGAGQSSRRLFLLHELQRGGDLRYHLAQDRWPGDTPFAPTAAARLLANVLLPLEFLHTAGYAHGDLKPDNILIGHDGYACLADWTSAVRLPELPPPAPSPTSSFTAPTAIPASASAEAETTETTAPVPVRLAAPVRANIGTLAYLSPERVQGGAASREADVWAYGVLVYEVLTGVLPWPDEPSEVRAAILASRVAPPPVPLPPGARSLLRELLQARSAARPPLARLRTARFFALAGLDWAALAARRPGLGPVTVPSGAEILASGLWDIEEQLAPPTEPVPEHVQPSAGAGSRSSVHLGNSLPAGLLHVADWDWHSDALVLSSAALLASSGLALQDGSRVHTLQALPLGQPLSTAAGHTVTRTAADSATLQFVAGGAPLVVRHPPAAHT